MNLKNYIAVTAIVIFIATTFIFYKESRNYQNQLAEAEANLIVLKNALANKDKEIEILKSSQEITNKTLIDLQKSITDNKELQNQFDKGLEKLKLDNPDWNSQVLPDEVTEFLNNADKAYREKDGEN